MQLGDLFAARGLLLVLHAQAERNPIQHRAKRLPALRAALGAVEASIAALSEPPVPPARVSRSLRAAPVAETALMDCTPTCYGPPSHSHRTEPMTLMEMPA